MMPEPPASAGSGRSAGQLLLLFGLLFATSLVIRPLWEPDEGRYTAGALEMLRTGDWWRPALNPEQPHYSKPPVVYWSVMAGLGLFGRWEWAARLPNLLAWLAILAVLVSSGRRFLPGRDKGLALIFASSAFPFVAFSFITPDILLSLWELLAAAAFLFARYQPGRRDSQFWLTVAFAALAMGFLTKGPPALLPWLAWWITAALLRDPVARRQAAWLPGIVLFLALGATWYVSVICYDLRLLPFYLRGEIVDRVFTSAHQRNPEWYKGLLIYGGLMTLGFLPWTAAAASALFKTRRDRLGGWWARCRKNEPWTVYLLVWLAFTLTLFLLIPSRLPLYILPLAAPWAWLLARVLPADGLVSRRRRTLLAAWGLLVFGAVAVVSAVTGNPRDVAAYLRRNGLLPADEIVFVETRPHYGLMFYTGLEVERCDLDDHTPLPGAPFRSFESVIREINEERESRLWIVKSESREALREQLKERAWIELETGPSYRHYAFFKTAAGPLGKKTNQ